MDVPPSSTGPCVVEEERLEPTQIGTGTLQRVDLCAKPPWGVPIVVVPVRNELAGRVLAGEVTLGPDRPTTLEPDVTKPGVVGDEIADRIGTVIDNNQFLIGIILAKEIADCLGDKRPAVAGRHNTRDQRQAFRTGRHVAILDRSAPCLISADGPRKTGGSAGIAPMYQPSRPFATITRR